MITPNEFERAARYYKNEAITEIIEEPLRNRAISEQEFKELISLYPPKHRYRIIWEILWFTGMRPLEACWLQRSNFNENFSQLCYKVAKPRREQQKDGTIKRIYKSRIVPISLDLSTRIKLYWEGIKMISPFEYLFPSFEPTRLSKGKFYINPRSLNFEISRNRKKLGGRWLEKNSYGDGLIAPHSFRRSWISRYLDWSNNVAETSRAIGHNDFSVTYGYYQLSEGEKKQKAFLEHSRVPEQETELESLRNEVAELKIMIAELAK